MWGERGCRALAEPPGHSQLLQKGWIYPKKKVGENTRPFSGWDAGWEGGSASLPRVLRALGRISLSGGRRAARPAALSLLVPGVGARPGAAIGVVTVGHQAAGKHGPWHGAGTRVLVAGGGHGAPGMDMGQRRSPSWGHGHPPKPCGGHVHPTGGSEGRSCPWKVLSCPELPWGRAGAGGDPSFCTTALATPHPAALCPPLGTLRPPLGAFGGRRGAQGAAWEPGAARHGSAQLGLAEFGSAQLSSA